MKLQRSLAVAALGLSLVGMLGTDSCQAARSGDVVVQKDIVPMQATVGAPEVVARFGDAMPTGVAVSRRGRIFVNFPRWEDGVPFTVGEVLKNGKVVPYPNAALAGDLTSVQSVVIDSKDRLWALDTGSVKWSAPDQDKAKLVCYDLATNKAIQTIKFGPDVLLPTTYLNDVRFDLSRGKAGTAFITDSSRTGDGALIVVDLASGQSMRRLHNHVSCRPVSGFVPFVEGAPLMVLNRQGEKETLKVGCDGIAMGADGKNLYYCPLSSRKLYSVSIDALCDPTVDDRKLGEMVCEVVEKGASDGLESDDKGRIYATDYEHNAIRRVDLKGHQETIVCDPRVLWPDTLSLAADGYLYFTCNQLHRQARFNAGVDKRQKPYVLFRVKVSPDSKPVTL